MKLTQIQQKDLKAFRRKQWLKQGKRCAVTGIKVRFSESVVDHKHKTKAEPVGVDGKGLIRGVLHFGVNALEGKIANVYKRYGLHKVAPLSEILRNVADYLDNPPVTNYIHPSAIVKIKRKKLNKTDIKRVQKYWKQMYPKRKLPKMPALVTKGKNKFYYQTKEWAEYIQQSRKLAGLE